MKVVVCIKHATDLPGPAVILDDGSGLDSLFVRSAMNDADRYALETALSLVENQGFGEVIALTVGSKDSEKTLRKCLAMGAGRAIRIEAENLSLHDPVSVGRALAWVCQREAAELVLCGVQSEDLAQQATGPVIGSALEVPCVSMITKLEVAEIGQPAIVHREAGGGRTEVWEVDLPCVLTVQTGFCSPRTENFKAVMMAKKATIEVLEPAELPPPRISIHEMKANKPSRSQLEFLQGGPTEVAARIRNLIKDAG